MKISKAKIEFPDNCPRGCPERGKVFSQGDICSRCPIFNCGGDPEYTLLRPEEYREDWAKVWKEWFDNGMKGSPDLRF